MLELADVAPPILVGSVGRMICIAALRSLAVHDVREETGKARKDAAKRRKNLAPLTADFVDRLSEIALGHYGATSPELAAYGLGVRVTPPSRKKHKTAKKAPTPGRGDGTNG